MAQQQGGHELVCDYWHEAIYEDSQCHATALIVGGFCQAVLDELPMEFALEAKALLAVSLEGAVG